MNLLANFILFLEYPYLRGAQANAATPYFTLFVNALRVINQGVDYFSTDWHNL